VEYGVILHQREENNSHQRGGKFVIYIQKKKRRAKIMFLSKAHNLLPFPRLLSQEWREQKICPLTEHYRVEP
jgi:hypothetical protein